MEFSWTRRWIHICSTCFTYLLVNIQKTTGKLHVFWGWATINGHVHLPFQFLEGIIQCPSYWHTLEHGDVFKTLSIPFPLIMFQIHCSCYLIWLRERYIYICLDGLKPPPRDDCAMVPNHFQDSPTPRLYLRSLTSFHIKCWGIFGKKSFSAMSKCGFRSKFPSKTRRSWILQRSRNRSRGPLMNWPVFHLTIQNETRRPLASLWNPQFFAVGSPWFCFMF